MFKRIAVIVLDGFGMKAMADAHEVRPQDSKASTLGSILRERPDLKLETLEKLGLMNSFSEESMNMKFNPDSNFGSSELMHFGADTFMGHQEIMGTKPKKPLIKPFSESIDKVEEHLKKYGHKVERIKVEHLSYLLVDDYATVADNLETDYGMVYNVTAPLDYMDFEKEVEIGKKVREVVDVARVIVFGGRGNNLDDLFNAQMVKLDKYVGVASAESKSYEKDYHCVHLGYGVDEKRQAPHLLNEVGVKTVLIGKVQDIVHNRHGINIACVETNKCFEHTLNEFKKLDRGFLCTNIQETDLSGHAQSVEKYVDILQKADRGLSKLIDVMNDQDLLIVMADHGNDPLIGHSKHTRERVPLLVYNSKISGVNLGLRKSLSDVSATVLDNFKASKAQNGESFLDLITK